MKVDCNHPCSHPLIPFNLCLNYRPLESHFTSSYGNRDYDIFLSQSQSDKFEEMKDK